MESIDFDPLGSITVQFDDKTYRLKRPKFGQWKYFSRLLQTLYDDNRETLASLTAAAQKEGKGQEKAQERLHEYQLQPFYESTIPWVREVFKQLSDVDLPESEDDWPTWLAADLSLPSQIVNHWKSNPKASGAAATI